MSMSNYRVFSENPYPLVQEEPIPAISFLDDCGNQFFDKATVQSLLKAKDIQFQQKDKLLLQRVNSSEKEELKAYKKPLTALTQFHTLLTSVVVRQSVKLGISAINIVSKNASPPVTTFTLS